jgi:integrase/recombinase XerC
MIKQKLSEASVNRRLSALRALAHKGRLLGVCNYTLEDIKGETVVKYRDTSGITPSEFKQTPAAIHLVLRLFSRI